jgi:choline kinase
MRSMDQIRISNPTLDDLEKDIDERRSAQYHMVGQLYKSVMESEIQVLYDMRHTLKYKQCEHDFYTEVDFNESEVRNKNLIYVAVVLNGRNICRRCGYADS